MVSVEGFEPSTHRLKVYCSTIWAIRSYWWAWGELNPPHLTFTHSRVFIPARPWKWPCSVHLHFQGLWSIFTLLIYIASGRLTEQLAFTPVRLCDSVESGLITSLWGRGGERKPSPSTSILYHICGDLSRGFWKVFQKFFQGLADLHHNS